MQVASPLRSAIHMNPYTRHLLKTSGRAELRSLVEAWDALESLVIRIYRAGDAGPEEETEFQALRRLLARELGIWGVALEPLWPGATIGGKPADQNPFEAVLARPKASAFVGDWTVMQTLPAARQALNSLLQGGPDREVTDVPG